MKLFICGYTGKGAGSRFIKWFTFGGISHVSLVFRAAGGQPPFEIESIQGAGVRRRPFIYAPDRMHLFSVPCDSGQALKVFDLARKLIGCKYDWSGIYGFIRRTKKENPDKWFCSELVAHCLAEAGIILHRLPAWKQSPVMVCASIALNPIELKSFVLNELQENDFYQYMQRSRPQGVALKKLTALCRTRREALFRCWEKVKKVLGGKSAGFARKNPVFLTKTHNVA